MQPLSVNYAVNMLHNKLICSVTTSSVWAYWVIGMARARGSQRAMRTRQQTPLADEAGGAWSDPRASEPKTHKRSTPGRGAVGGVLLRIGALVLAAYMLGVQELLSAAHGILAQ